MSQSYHLHESHLMEPTSKPIVELHQFFYIRIKEQERQSDIFSNNYF